MISDSLRTRLDLSDYNPTDDLARAATMPSRWYTDPAFLELETPQIFWKTWQPVGRLDQAQIHDGRVNSSDLGAEVALYCTVGGGLSVWDINLEGQGSVRAKLTHGEIEAGFTQAGLTGVNQLLGSDAQGNSLYALSDGHTITFAGPDLREPGKTYLFTVERTVCG